MDKGWCQGISKSSQGAFCAVGAVTWDPAINRGKSYHAVRIIDMMQYLLPSLDSGYPPLLHHWNDKPERTKGEVLALYDMAISAAMSDEAMES